ncbi:MAG: outer membrane protein assembly factor BamA [Candidatus Eisenbacteria bacterium]|nr:outer membrane protein assembly factor BamA [Candidatus Eisenbacteria bacterium]
MHSRGQTHRCYSRALLFNLVVFFLLVAAWPVVFSGVTAGPFSSSAEAQVSPPIPDGGRADSLSPAHGGTAPLTLSTGADSLAAAADTARAAGAVEAARVLEVRVSGLESVDSSVVLNAFGVFPGDVFSYESVREGVKSLHGLGYFSDVTVDGEELPDGIVLKVVVTETPRVVALKFSGSKGLEDDKLKEKLTLKENDFYTESAVFEAKQAIVAAYREEGYPAASVKAVTTVEKGKGKVELTFEIEEGKKVRIKAIDFAGNASIQSSKLKKVMDLEVKSWWRGGKFKQETLETDFEKIVTYYRSNGFRDAAVTGHEITYSEDKRDLYLKILVTEGPRYRLGDVRWTGCAAVRSEALGKLSAVASGEVYNIEKLEKMQAGAYELYAEQGYIFLDIDRQESVRDTVVDVAYAIQEGQPSFVKHILVSGNDRTKEKVIRRELSIKPGELFKRSALLRSQRDVFSLGFFEDVLIDYRVDEPPDIDLIFQMKEKQTGTATAGAGYTSDSGLTGFVELGHNNLFGNGQSIMLHLEKGSKRSNYDLSFTEPWFRDTPTSLGIDVYNMERERDYYDELRKGGGVRVGRPLPWPDYTRGYVSYTLEDVSLKDFSASYTGSLDEVSWPQRTSRVETAIVRNSTDNPFYPTRGSRFSVNSEFSGGLLGGDLNFHKQVVDYRVYRNIVWKAALLTRLRVGWMDAYNHYERVPEYERFRLGGTTVDFLRGYPDYDIVPEANVYEVDGQTVRWPGGRLMGAVTLEFQFPIADPLRGLFFLDVGDTWNNETEIDLNGFKKGAGVGLRLEVPMLGVVGFDFGYGFDREGGGKWEPHFIMGKLF